MNGQVLTDLRKMAEEVSSREGCFLYDIEFIGAGNGRVLRVYIDREAEGGASIEDCSNISRGLNLRLDVEDVIPGGAYSLEVSTPGLERVLKEPRHFSSAIGKKIMVKTFQQLAEFNPHLVVELGNAKQIQGVLKSYNPGTSELGAHAPESLQPEPGSASSEAAGSANRQAAGSANLQAAGLKIELATKLKSDRESEVDSQLRSELEAQGREVFIPLQSVTKAHVVFEFADPAEKKKSLKKPKGKAK